MANTIFVGPIIFGELTRNHQSECQKLVDDYL
jgi:hypothetical protein